MSSNAEPSIEQTLDGITIDSSDDDENALDSIRRKREFDSNEIDERDSHVEKLDDPRISISNGMTKSGDVEKLRIKL
jgi:hypothetical protein